jgi:hypothetical protein
LAGRSIFLFVLRFFYWLTESFDLVIFSELDAVASDFGEFHQDSFLRFEEFDLELVLPTVAMLCLSGAATDMFWVMALDFLRHQGSVLILRMLL